MVHVRLSRIRNLVVSSIGFLFNLAGVGPRPIRLSRDGRLWYAAFQLSLHRHASNSLFLPKTAAILDSTVKVSDAPVRDLVHLDFRSDWLIPRVEFTLVRALFQPRYIAVHDMLSWHHGIAVGLEITLLIQWALCPQWPLHFGLKDARYGDFLRPPLRHFPSLVFDSKALVPLDVRSSLDCRHGCLTF